MAEITKNGTPSLVSINPPQNDSIVGLFAGETIAPGDFCYIKAADGLVYRSSNAAANAAQKVDGVYLSSASATVGMPVTLFEGVNVAYATGLTIAARLFVSGTVPGGLADATTNSGPVVAKAISATKIRILHQP